MIPHSSAGGQSWGHQMRSLNGGPTRADQAVAPVQSDLTVESSQPPSRQPVAIDLTGGGTGDGSESQDREPPPKRPRLDVSGSSNLGDTATTVNTTETKNTPGSAGPRPLPGSRGRPLWSFQAVMSEIPGSDNRSGGTASKPSSPPPFPAQPWSNASGNRSRNTDTKSAEDVPDTTVQTTPYRIQVPSVAPKIKGDKIAGFAPWTGNHPEDLLNEQTAKQGYYDRTQVSQNESNTARPALYTQFKHRAGLQMLSSVFTAVLEKRQNHNTVNAPSTFKPPPRVTLTDNKREAWLRDLANQSVPLRRLSRTIPHGIRGKVLLDQCLGKWIPVARAVWLAKCVGANEIRAFKRKGTSGALAVGLEAKWVRDWTSNVQQFVEGVFSSPKSLNWKSKMTYVVGLTARLFFENLLDHDGFLEWFLSSFEAASLATVPVWLLMLGIYWNNILRYRRRGRHLAEILLQKLRQINEVKLSTLQPLVDRLSRFITKLAREHTSSMILPNSWDLYKPHVSSCLDVEHKADRVLFQSLAERNARVQRPRQSKQTVRGSPQQRIIRLLDSILSTRDILSVSSACLDVVSNRAVLVSKLLEWLATPFRHGICRVYIGVRLLRKWKASGVDIDDHILAFLTRTGSNKVLNMDNIYHTVSELVRSQTFSVGRYLQWLMAKGITSSATTVTKEIQDLPCDIGLIIQLPVGRLPEHVSNLRGTLLTRMGFSASEETAAIANAKDLICRRLPSIFDMPMDAKAPLEILPPNLSWAVKAEVCQWLRRAIAEYTCDATHLNLQNAFSDKVSSISAISPNEFYIVRDILENFGDLSMLADVLRITSTSEDYTVLASIADTTNCHFDSLCAIGATADLFRKIVDAYAGLKRFGIPNLDLMFSLIELGMRIPNELNTVAILRQDLSRIENRSVAAASSPVSDHIPDSLGDADPLFREKLDHFLLSGNIMDEPTLDNIFNTLTKHLESGNADAKLSANDTCRYLAQLRSFQPKHFDSILARWVCSHLRTSDRCTLLRILPPLIGVGCVTIRSFLSLVKRISYSAKVIPNATSLPADLVALLVTRAGDDGCLDLVSYRFRLAQQEFLSKDSDQALGIVCAAAAALDTSESTSAAQRVKLENSMVTLLHELLVRNPGCSDQKCVQKLLNQHPAALALLKQALNILLGVQSKRRLSGVEDVSTLASNPSETQDTIVSEVEKLASTTDDFSLPFCQLKLQVLFNADTGNESRDSFVDAMFKTVVADSRSQKLHWVDLVTLMSPDAVRQIRERAEKEFFAVPLLEDSTETSSPRNMGTLQTAKLYLTIIEELAGSIPDSGTPTIASAIVEKMETLLQKILTMQPSHDKKSGGSSTNKERSHFERSLAFWFSALLRMVVLHRASFMPPSPTLKIGFPQEQSRLLTSIFCIALSRLPGEVLRLFPGADYFPHPSASDNHCPCPGILLQTHALDVAASLIDVFPDEIRLQCARFLKDKCPPFVSLQNDTRFSYLLGPISDLSSTATIHSASAPSPAASASTPTPSSANYFASATYPQQPAPPSASSTGLADSSSCIANRLRLDHRGRIGAPYQIRSWELLEDAAPFVGVNDTAVNLSYFDARRVRV